jgi:hypothetical protein
MALKKKFAGDPPATELVIMVVIKSPNLGPDAIDIALCRSQLGVQNRLRTWALEHWDKALKKAPTMGDPNNYLDPAQRYFETAKSWGEQYRIVDQVEIWD